MFRFVSECYIILIMTTTVIVWAMQEVETSSLIWSTTVLDIETDNLSTRNWATFSSEVVCSFTISAVKIVKIWKADDCPLICLPGQITYIDVLS